MGADARIGKPDQYLQARAMRPQLNQIMESNSKAIEGRSSAPCSSVAKVKWARSAALEVARELCDRLKPHCEKLIVAGSLRRRKLEVCDVEILYISRMAERPLDMFLTQSVSLADMENHRSVDGTIK